ncbi:unnamed protein product, partial [Protopolystoma xenopodis]
TLTIGSVRPNDEGSYTCSPDIETEVRHSRTFHLRVLRKAVLSVTPTDTIVSRLGVSVRLNCSLGQTFRGSRDKINRENSRVGAYDSGGRSIASLSRSIGSRNGGAEGDTVHHITGKMFTDTANWIPLSYEQNTHYGKTVGPGWFFNGRQLDQLADQRDFNIQGTYKLKIIQKFACLSEFTALLKIQ